MDDNRVGIVVDGVKQYPAKDIYGNDYTRPATTVSVGGARFVVVPVGFDAKANAMLLKSFAPIVSRKSSKPAKTAQDLEDALNDQQD